MNNEIDCIHLDPGLPQGLIYRVGVSRASQASTGPGSFGASFQSSHSSCSLYVRVHTIFHQYTVSAIFRLLYLGNMLFLTIHASYRDPQWVCLLPVHI